MFETKKNQIEQIERSFPLQEANKDWLTGEITNCFRDGEVHKVDWVYLKPDSSWIIDHSIHYMKDRQNNLTVPLSSVVISVAGL